MTLSSVPQLAHLYVQSDQELTRVEVRSELEIRGGCSLSLRAFRRHRLHDMVTW